MRCRSCGDNISFGDYVKSKGMCLYCNVAKRNVAEAKAVDIKITQMKTIIKKSQAREKYFKESEQR